MASSTGQGFVLATLTRQLFRPREPGLKQNRGKGYL
jgi:hypothetical protein